MAEPVGTWVRRERCDAEPGRCLQPAGAMDGPSRGAAGGLRGGGRRHRPLVLSGPALRWSDTRQLVINTGTTIVTFLMVFLIQDTQNRDTQALQLKIGELIRADEKARNRLLRLEEMSEAEMNH